MVHVHGSCGFKLATKVRYQPLLWCVGAWIGPARAVSIRCPIWRVSGEDPVDFGNNMRPGSDTAYTRLVVVDGGNPTCRTALLPWSQDAHTVDEGKGRQDFVWFEHDASAGVSAL